MDPLPFQGNFSSDYNGVVVERSGFSPCAWFFSTFGGVDFGATDAPFVKGGGGVCPWGQQGGSLESGCRTCLFPICHSPRHQHCTNNSHIFFARCALKIAKELVVASMRTLKQRLAM